MQLYFQVDIVSINITEDESSEIIYLMVMEGEYK